MKFFKVLLLVLVFLLLAGAGTAFYLWSQRVPLLEKTANQAAHELFEGTIRLKSVEMKDWRLIIEGAEGIMKMDTRRVPVAIAKLETVTPLWESAVTRRSEIAFQDFRPAAAAQSTPVSGTVRLRGRAPQSFRLQADLKRVWIADYAWIDPVNFEGLQGYVSGTVKLRVDTNEKAKFDINLKSDSDGGEVPARFLEFALPYLPKAQNTKELRSRIQKTQGVKFTGGLLTAETPEPGKIQAQLKLLFPELNINLNLNLTILVDEEHAFLRAFKLLGLFKIQAGAQ